MQQEPARGNGPWKTGKWNLRLTFEEAQAFLAQHGISDLQGAILSCCRVSEAESGWHPLLLALCVEIARHTQAKIGMAPLPETFEGIPTEGRLEELVQRFLVALSQRGKELWLVDLSLTPRFDEKVALALDAWRGYGNGRKGWEWLVGLAFLEHRPEAFYSFPAPLREVLSASLSASEVVALHRWFRDHWAERKEAGLAWFHLWSLDPAGALAAWERLHGRALEEGRHEEAQRLLGWWSEIVLEEADQRRLGDELWAKTHEALSLAWWKTPWVPKEYALRKALCHGFAVLKVFTREGYPEPWARVQANLGNVYMDLPDGERGENVRRAIACYEAALQVFTLASHPEEWAQVQMNLGTAYTELPTEERAEALQRALACYRAALQVFTPDTHPQWWAWTQWNSGVAYASLPLGGAEENLQQAILCFRAALKVLSPRQEPRDWAMVQMNLGQAWRRLAEVRKDPSLLPRAVGAFTAAFQGFSQEGLEEEAREALQAAQEAQRALEAEAPPLTRCRSGCPDMARENTL